MYLGQASSEVNLESEYTDIQLDLDRLQACALILTELLANALTHANCDSSLGNALTVNCSLRQDNEHVTLTVEDSGKGIRAEEKAKLYDQKDKGLGLVQELTDQLSGILSGPDRPEGGTRWEVKFPFVKRCVVAKVSGNGPSVLLVEDDIHDGLFYRKILEVAGYSVIGPVDNAENALRLVNENHPALAVVDLCLHGDTSAGVRLVETIFNRIDQRTCCQVLFHTVLPPTEEDYDRAACIPAARFLIKHRERPDVLTANLKNMIRQRLKGNTIFVCYAHEHADVCKNFVDQIKLHNDHGRSQVQAWCDTEIKLGDSWFDSIDAKLETAIAAVLLIDINFMKSDFIQNKELPRLLNYAKSRGTVLVPILLYSTGVALPDGGSLDALQFAGDTKNMPLLGIGERSRADYHSKIVEIVNEMFDALRWRPK